MSDSDRNSRYLQFLANSPEEVEYREGAMDAFRLFLLHAELRDSDVSEEYIRGAADMASKILSDLEEEERHSKDAPF